eukprot:6005653-Amphidinium_carterae.1
MFSPSSLKVPKEPAGVQRNALFVWHNSVDSFWFRPFARKPLSGAQSSSCPLHANYLHIQKLTCMSRLQHTLEVIGVREQCHNTGQRTCTPGKVAFHIPMVPSDVEVPLI